MAITPAMALKIEQKAEEVRRLAARDEAGELDRLRDATATLQVMIAEAARLQRLQRRFDTHGAAVVFPVLIESAEFVGYCLVNNLAPEGMNATVYANFSRQQPVSVHFTSEQMVQGTLVWSEHRQMGVQFDHEIDVAQVLCGPERKGHGRSGVRPARLPIDCLAEINVGRRSDFVEVRDVSQRGMKVLTELGEPGGQVTIQLDGLEERKALIRWSQAGTVGLNFTEPLSLRELAAFGQSALLDL